MSNLERAIAEAFGLAETAAFQGVLEVRSDGAVVANEAFGLADRRHQIANTTKTRFGIASGTKGFTALTIMSLIEEGILDLTTSAADLVGTDLPLIDQAVTVEHLLAHRSGIGDYLDEAQLGDINDYIMSVPVHELIATEDYLAELAGHPQVFPPGDKFVYNNSGFVVLALLAERAAKQPFHDLVDQRVCNAAGLRATGFLRGDELDGTVAVGYLADTGLRTNTYHLPVRGSGDGGIISTATDIMDLWAAAFAGQVVKPDTLTAMVTPRSTVAGADLRYGLGFWLAGDGPVAQLIGCDAGVSFKTAYNPATRTGFVVISNTSDGVWPLATALAAGLATD